MMRKVLTAVCLALGLMAIASTASAKWAAGNGFADLDVNAVDPAAPIVQVCTNHVDGRAGIRTFDDPAVTPPPAGPYPALTVEMFTGPPASLDGAQGTAGGLLLNDGTLLPPLATITTAPATKLDPVEPYPNPFGTPAWVYAAAPFRFDVAAGRIAPGDQVAFRQGTHVAVAILTAVACAPPAPIAATIDVLPGIASNPVIPALRLPLLPVRVFGSASLDVTKIATVKLGNASPVAIPGWLARFFAPKDRNGDGYLDRDYVFVPAATGIACGATSVSLTGTLTGGEKFAGKDAIKTIRC